MGGSRLIVATESPAARDGIAACAATAAACALERQAGTLVVEVAERARRPTLLASEAARALEGSLRGAGLPDAAARGRICWLTLSAAVPDELRRAAAIAADSDAAVLAFVPAGEFLAVIGAGEVHASAALLRCDPRTERPLCALAVRELREHGVRVRIWGDPIGPVSARRALAGLDPGGDVGRRARRIARGLGIRSPSKASP